MQRILVRVVIGLLVAGFGAAERSGQFSSDDDSAAAAQSFAAPDDEGVELRVGDAWNITSLTDASAPHIIIGRIEGDITHISVVNGQMAGGPNSVAHIPIATYQVQRSVMSMRAVGQFSPADFETGYAQWQAADGGAFDMLVGDALKLIAQAS